MNVSDNDALDQIRNLFTEFRVFRANRHIYGGCVQRIPGAWDGDWKVDYNTRVIVLVRCSELKGGFKLMSAVTFINNSTYKAYRHVLSNKVTDEFIPHLKNIIAGYAKSFDRDLVGEQIDEMRASFIKGDESTFNSFMNYVFSLNDGPDHCYDTRYIVRETVKFFNGLRRRSITWDDDIDIASINKPKTKPKDTKPKQKKPKKEESSKTVKRANQFGPPVDPEIRYRSARFNHYASNAWKYLFKPNPSSKQPYIEILEHEDDNVIYTDIDVTVFILQVQGGCKPAMETYQQFIRPDYRSLINDIAKDIVEFSGFKKLNIPFNFYEVSDVIVVSDYRLLIKFSLRV